MIYLIRSVSEANACLGAMTANDKPDMEHT